MRRILVIIIALSMGYFANAQKHRLSVVVSGIDIRTKGKLNVGIFTEAQAKEYGQRKVFGNKVEPKFGKTPDIAEKETMTVDFDLVPGTYAIAIYQDEDGNGKLNKGLFGAPTEPYAFSNQARATFSAPKFKKASFEVKGDTEVKIDFDE